MKLIIGLGNPGEEHKDNRHSVGYFVVDELKKLRTKELKNIKIAGTDVYMNNSGDFVKKLVDQYKINISDLWIIHDDLDIKLGDYKIQFGTGPKVHGGINDIEEKLGTKGFWRVRIGIENRQVEPFDFAQGKEYVLQDFTEGELDVLKDVVIKVSQEVLQRTSTV